jgi:hypothetical protein
VLQVAGHLGQQGQSFGEGGPAGLLRVGQDAHHHFVEHAGGPARHVEVAPRDRVERSGEHSAHGSHVNDLPWRTN